MGEDASALRRLLDVVGQLVAERRSKQVLAAFWTVRVTWREPDTPQSVCPTVTADLRCSSPLEWTPRRGTGSGHFRGPKTARARC